MRYKHFVVENVIEVSGTTQQEEDNWRHITGHSN